MRRSDWVLPAGLFLTLAIWGSLWAWWQTEVNAAEAEVARTSTTQPFDTGD